MVSQKHLFGKFVEKCHNWRKERMGPKIVNDLNGWLVIDKPYGMGSTEVVSRLKRLFHPRKIGHAGTLDPLATGVLPIAMGKATRTVPFVMNGLKNIRFKFNSDKQQRRMIWKVKSLPLRIIGLPKTKLRRFYLLLRAIFFRCLRLTVL